MTEHEAKIYNWAKSKMDNPEFVQRIVDQSDYDLVVVPIVCDYVWHKMAFRRKERMFTNIDYREGDAFRSIQLPIYQDQLPKNMVLVNGYVGLITQKSSRAIVSIDKDGGRVCGVGDDLQEAVNAAKMVLN